MIRNAAMLRLRGARCGMIVPLVPRKFLEGSRGTICLTFHRHEANILIVGPYSRNLVSSMNWLRSVVVISTSYVICGDT